jgi:hypothetical protein
MKILITGDRNWTNRLEMSKVLSKFSPGTTIVNGGCRGADKMSTEIGKELGFDVIIVEADWRIGRAAGPIRNQKMLDLKPDIVLAFHENLSESKGTKDMIKKAEKKGYEVRIFGMK